MTMAKRPFLTVLKLLALAGATVALAGCAEDQNRLSFGGVYFKTQTRKLDADPRQFFVIVDQATRSLDSALQAGAYEGTKYCIPNYGTSRIRWTVGPDTPPSQLRVTDNAITMAGACNP